MQNYNKTDGLIMGVISLFYILGAIQLGRPEMRALYAGMTPWVLLLSILFLSFYDQTQQRLKLLFFMLLVAVVSFVVEVCGVATGVVFGSYSYGAELGVKVADTPLIIGVNWVLLIYLSAAMLSSFPRSPLYWIVLPSALMVGYDVVMEQVAPRMGMWSWGGDVVPLQNYAVWAFLALLFHTLRYVMNISVRNKMALFLFSIQFFFFFIILIV